MIFILLPTKYIFTYLLSYFMLILHNIRHTISNTINYLSKSKGVLTLNIKTEALRNACTRY